MNIQEAFHILDTLQEGIPFEQIDFLRNHNEKEQIEVKIQKVLEKAYTEEVMLGHLSNQTPHTGLWYSIVAEEHASTTLAKTIVSMLTNDKSVDWDLMNEQLLYLIGLLSSKSAENVEIFLSAIEEQISKKKKNTAYSYLFETVYFSNSIQKEQIIRILRKLSGFDQTIMMSMLLETNQTDYIDLAKSIVKPENEFEDKESMEFNMNKELQALIQMSENGEIENRCYFTNRGNWKEHYKQLETLFVTQAPSLAEVSNQTVHRNDPCPCGSGKKYKKCCGMVN